MRKLHALLLGGVAGHTSFARLANTELAPLLALQLADNRSKCEMHIVWTPSGSA